MFVMEEVETFLAIARSGSLAQAARLVHVSQSTVSYRLECLEKRVGHALVLRARGIRGAELTAAGLRYLDLAERWESLVNAAARLRDDRMAGLAVGSVDAINIYLFDPIIDGLAERLPELHLTVETGRGDELSDRVVAGHLDVAFVFYLPTHADLRVTALARYSMVAVLRDEPTSEVESVADLAGRPEIHLPWGPDYDLWREHNGLPEPAHTVTKAHSLPPVLRLPGSWALVPTFIADDLATKTGCHVVSLRNGPPPRSVYRVERKHRRASNSAALHALDDVLASLFR